MSVPARSCPQGSSSSIRLDTFLARPEKLFGGYMLQNLRRFTVCAVLLFVGGLATAGVPEGGYHLLKKYDLGAAPGGKEYWDYITFDAATHRLYISHNQ